VGFSHEKLNVYQKALDFIEFIKNSVPSDLSKQSVIDQLDRAATSIPLNIAEGTGKYTPKDKCRYYDIARGSALECAACLDILQKRNIINVKAVEEGKQILFEIVSMLIGLIKSSSDRVYEDEIDYK
jgi:four helix bundle protein